jgi:hypothetical protein
VPHESLGQHKRRKKSKEKNSYVFRINVLKDVKKVKFILELATKAQTWSRCKLYSFFNLGARWGWVVNATPRLLTPRKDPVLVV